MLADLVCFSNNSNTHTYNLNSQFVFSQYVQFRQKMNETGHLDDYRSELPRKVVKCPKSQFTLAIHSPSDHRRETFRFIGDDNIPYTRFGRNKQKHIEIQIETLKGWKAEPLL